MTLSLLAHEELLRAEGELRRELAEARAEIAQLQTDKEQLRREMNMLIEGAFAADARAEEAHAALDAAKVPRKHDGRALTLAERIAAALPPLPEPAGQWCVLPMNSWYRWIGDGVGVCTVEGKRQITIRGVLHDEASALQMIACLRLALGPAGIPPTTGQGD